jgi:hypothetical protein
LEEAGLGERVLLVVPVDRVTGLYQGDGVSIPQSVSIFNVYQTNDAGLPGAPIHQQNVENWDASSEDGPRNGDRGGWLEPVNHTTIDNSPAVLERIIARITDHLLND